MLTTKDAVKMFEAAGLPRNQRSIERYCNDEKLDCFFESDEARYYITPGSVERLVAQLKEIRSRHDAIPDVGPAPTMSDTGRQAPTPAAQPAESPDVLAKIKELEDKLFHLEVDKRAKEQVVTMLRDQIKEDRNEYHKQINAITTQLVSQSHQIGTLETKLMQIEAPKAPRVAADTTTPPPTTAADGQRVQVASVNSEPSTAHARVFEVPVEEIHDKPADELHPA